MSVCFTEVCRVWRLDTEKNKYFSRIFNILWRITTVARGHATVTSEKHMQIAKTNKKNIANCKAQSKDVQTKTERFPRGAL